MITKFPNLLKKDLSQIFFFLFYHLEIHQLVKGQPFDKSNLKCFSCIQISKKISLIKSPIHRNPSLFHFFLFCILKYKNQWISFAFFLSSWYCPFLSLILKFVNLESISFSSVLNKFQEEIKDTEAIINSNTKENKKINSVGTKGKQHGRLSFKNKGRNNTTNIIFKLMNNKFSSRTL